MTLDLSKVEVVENEQKRRFEVQVGDHTAVMYRYYAGNDLVVTHTGVPKELSGQGLASHMAKTVLDQARQQGRGVVPICPFLAAYITRHPEYQDLVTEAPE